MRTTYFIIFCLWMQFCSVAWSVSPQIISKFPADNSFHVGKTDSLNIVFDQIIESTWGKLTVYNVDLDEVFETIDLSGPAVTGIGTNQLIIKLSKSLSFNQSYYVQVDKDAFWDGFEGFTGRSNWNFTTGNILEEVVYSQYVNDDFKIFISLPLNYEQNDTASFPVVYYTDGNWLYAAAETNPEREDIVPLINVLIGYPENYDFGTIRLRDMMYSRGLEQFYSFFAFELYPKILQEYRVNKSHAGLIGYSLGGLFSYVVFLKSQIAGNPYIPNIVSGDASLYDRTTSGVTMLNLTRSLLDTLQFMPGTKLFMTAAENNGNRAWVSPIANWLGSKDFPSLLLNYKYYPGTNHFTASDSTYEDGLLWCYGLDAPQLPSGFQPVERTEIIVSPNPASDFITLPADYVMRYCEIISITGGVVYKQLITTSENKIDIRSLNPGLYFIRGMTTGNQTINSKFVKL